LAFYTYGALGTDRYPPFTLGEAPGYPATLDVAYPQHLSRGLVLVKWWLLALPHYLILAFFVGGGTYAASRARSWSTGSGASDGWSSGFDPIELHGSGPTADPGALDLDAVLGDVRVRATAAGPGAFVGIGPADAVAGYLTTVDRDRLVDLRSGQAVQQRLPGGAPATPPAQQTFWVASAAGAGPQQLTWTPTDGRWVVAVMNADGSRPVDVELSAGATLPHLRWLWIGLFVGAALALVVGAVLVVLAVRRRPSV
jgi:hypothetical protein